MQRLSNLSHGLDSVAIQSELFREETRFEELFYVLGVEVTGFTLKSVLADFYIDLFSDFDILLVLCEHGLLVRQLFEDVQEQTIDISGLLLVLVKFLRENS